MTDDSKPNANAHSSTKPALDWSGTAPFPFTRESSIRLDDKGIFWHEGFKIDHPGLQRGMHAWLTRHPTDGRYVLENGYDWCYLTIDIAPFFVRSARVEDDRLHGVLSDGSEVTIDEHTLTIDDGGALWCLVKPALRGGVAPARFDAHAMVAIGDAIEQRDDGAWRLHLGANEIPIRRG